MIADLKTLSQMYVIRVEHGSIIPIPMFWVDLLSVIPWEWVECIESAQTENLSLLRVFRLIKLFRLHRSAEICVACSTTCVNTIGFLDQCSV
jgi:hypothetical protein